MLRPLYLIALIAISAEASAEQFASPVSIYQLLSTPDKFENQLILVKGFMGSEGYQQALYPSENDAKISNVGARVVFSEDIESSGILDRCKWSYVSLAGVFSIDDKTGQNKFTSIRSLSTYGDLKSSESTVRSKPCK